jgi:FAD:protein FMN transferase
MMIQHARAVLLGFLIGIYGDVTGSSRDANEFEFHHENVMGTSLELRLAADSEQAARAAEDRVLHEIDRLSAIFSGYDPNSEFSRWQAVSKGPVKISRELFEVLKASDSWREQSGGAFDPRVEILSRLWSRCAKQNRTPTADELDTARANMNRPAWRLDHEVGTAERLSDCPISLNAIAKGYIVEKACKAAFDADERVRDVLLNVGGDMRVRGKLGRTLGVASPFADSESSEPIALIEVRDRAVATSGRSQRGFRIDGKWFSHILDPRTGWPVQGIASATVIAERSADADALDTIFNVLTPEESLQLVKALPGVECLIVASDGHETRSGGWRQFERLRPLNHVLASTAGQERTDSAKGDAAKSKDAADPKKEKSKAAANTGWGADFELAVDFEINHPAEMTNRYRRPYVVVWVEDKNEVPVRTLLLWVSSAGAGPEKWLPDLRRWYLGEEKRRLTDTIDVVHTTSRPTRSAGKYSIIWDGTDNHGKPLDRGQYTVFIEAAREHGTYQSIRKAITIADKPFAEDLKGNVEIKSASIEYRRKAPPK